MSEKALTKAGDDKSTPIEGARAKDGRQLTVRPALRKALTLMVFEGKARAEAAAAANIKDHTLYVAMRKPHVRGFMAELEREFRSGAARRALHRIDHLAHNAGSEHVQLSSAQFIWEIEHGKPVARSEHHEKREETRRVIFKVDGAQAEAARLIEGQAVVTAESFAALEDRRDGFNSRAVETEETDPSE